MSPPTVWGPPVWTLFHTLAEKIKEEDFTRLMPSLLQMIKRICNYLPCPECSEHATRFLLQVKHEHVSTKLDFKNMLYFFHNTVNKRKQKPIFEYSNMEKYKNINLIQSYNKFLTVYNNKGNMKMLTESFQRQFVINDLKKFIIGNINSFS